MPRIIEELKKLGREKHANLTLGDLAELHVKEKFGDPAQDSPLWACLLQLLAAAESTAYNNAHDMGIDIEAIELAFQTDQVWVNWANQDRAAMKKHSQAPKHDDYDTPSNIFETDDHIIEISSSLERGELPVEAITMTYISDQIGKRLFGPSWKSHMYQV